MQSKKWKRHSARRSRRELKRKRQKRRRNSSNAPSAAKKQSVANRRASDHVIALSGELDLVENATHTRRELLKLARYRPHKPRSDHVQLFLDLAEITDVDPCALLYLVAQIKRVAATGYVHVRGNFPRAYCARRVFSPDNSREKAFLERKTRVNC